VRAELTDPTLQRDPMGKLRKRFPDIVELEYVGRAIHDEGKPGRRQAEPELNPLTLITRYWEESVGKAPTDEEAALLEAAIRAGFSDVEVPA
jgi:hypothetical protein